MTTETLSQLGAAGAIQSVFRRDDATVVALPEVRIEFDTSRERRRVFKMLPGLSKFTVLEDTSDRLVLRPNSGKGEDALDLANRIQEMAKPASVSPRFVQFVPKR